jgi:hypothetical protein
METSWCDAESDGSRFAIRRRVKTSSQTREDLGMVHFYVSLLFEKLKGLAILTG